MKRLFLAVDLSARARQELADAVSWMKAFGDRVKVVPPENYHLTLKFLGSVPDERAQDVPRALEAPGAVPASCDLRLEGWGAFPPKGNPDIFWAGVGPPGALDRAVDRCEAAMEALGFVRENHGFHAHMTLARTVNRHAPPPFLAAWKALAPLSGPAFRADRIVLYESLPGQKAPVYRPLARVEL